MTNLKFRIISGQWRGRIFQVPNKLELRPTKNRIKETLFNWLTPVIKNSNCLDCFAGSGALGIEALSRYANNVTLLENSYSLVKQIKKNLFLLKGNGIVIKTNTISWLSNYGKPFNIIFLDPPFYYGLLMICIQLLEKNNWLSDKSWIYIETEIKNNNIIKIPSNWYLYREKNTNNVRYLLYIRYK